MAEEEIQSVDELKANLEEYETQRSAVRLYILIHAQYEQSGTSRVCVEGLW